MSYGFRTGGYRGPSYRSYGGGGFSFGPLLTPIVKQLIIANVVVFFLMSLLGAFSPGWQRSFVYLFGLVPNGIFSGFLWQPVTYLFLHSGFMHIFFNMFALWMFGAALEREWGRRRFLKYYFITGVGAGVFSVLVTTLTVSAGWMAAGRFDPMTIPTIGASGAIYGILLAFGLLFPNTPILVMFLFPIPARIFVMIFGALAFLSALSGPGSGVSHVAHLGGMVIGYVYLRGDRFFYRAAGSYSEWRRQQRRRKFEVYRREQDEREKDPRPPDHWVN
jgi:membrane associated rhomboid family serine protease